MIRVIVLIGIFSANIARITVFDRDLDFSFGLSILSILLVCCNIGLMFIVRDSVASTAMLLFDALLFSAASTWLLLASFNPQIMQADIIYFVIVNSVLGASILILDIYDRGILTERTAGKMSVRLSRESIRSNNSHLIGVDLDRGRLSGGISPSTKSPMASALGALDNDHEHDHDRDTGTSESKALAPAAHTLDCFGTGRTSPEPTEPIIFRESCVYNGFRIKMSRLNGTNPRTPTNLDWTDFASPVHRVTSSSCHIYTALWGTTPVVLKIIKAERLSSAVALSEFEMEACALSRTSHPHIIKLLGSGARPRPFLVLELLGGGTLAHRMGTRSDWRNAALAAAGGNLRTPFYKKSHTYSEALRDALAMANALSYLHHGWHGQMHILHRDLKPDNIGYTADGTLKLFDFGLCACVRTTQVANSSRAEYGASSATESGSGTGDDHTNDSSGAGMGPGEEPVQESYAMTGNTGTLRYMAPEVALGQPYDRSVDAFSFAIIVWQLLTGQVPFARLGRQAFLERVIVAGRRPALDSRWPEPLKNLLRRCWDNDRRKRPNFPQIVATLHRIIQLEKDAQFAPPAPEPAPCSSSRVRYFGPTVVLTGSLLGLAVACSFVARSGGQDPVATLFFFLAVSCLYSAGVVRGQCFGLRQLCGSWCPSHAVGSGTKSGGHSQTLGSRSDSGDWRDLERGSVSGPTHGYSSSSVVRSISGRDVFNPIASQGQLATTR